MTPIHGTNPLMRGPHVREVQRLLISRQFLPKGSDDGIAGPATLHAFVLAKRHYHYPKKDQTPSCGDRLVEILQTGKSPFHQVPILHSHHESDAAKLEHQVRTRLAKLMDEGVANKARIHYAQIRPFPIHLDENHWAHEEFSTDCSGSYTILCRLAGLPKDPNGANYNGSGYTGTLMAHMRPITRAQLKIGDAVIFGNFPGHHVVMVRELGGDPKIFSHGQEAGPWYSPLSYEAKFQSNVVHYYSIF